MSRLSGFSGVLDRLLTSGLDGRPFISGALPVLHSLATAGGDPPAPPSRTPAPVPLGPPVPARQPGATIKPPEEVFPNRGPGDRIKQGPAHPASEINTVVNSAIAAANVAQAYAFYKADLLARKIQRQAEGKLTPKEIVKYAPLAYEAFKEAFNGINGVIREGVQEARIAFPTAAEKQAIAEGRITPEQLAAAIKSGVPGQLEQLVRQPPAPPAPPSAPPPPAPAAPLPTPLAPPLTSPPLVPPLAPAPDLSRAADVPDGLHAEPPRDC